MIKFSNNTVVIGCDYCGIVVYVATISGIKADLQKPLISGGQAYKVHCEKCSIEPIQQSMASISKTQELEDKIRELQKKLGIREKKVKKMIDKYKDSLD